MIDNKDVILITGGSGFIGTNLIELFENKGYTLLNFDKNPPTKLNQSKYWHKGNILNMEDLDSVFLKYNPTVVIHLAAITDTASDDLDYYIDNTKGTENVVNRVRNNSNVRRFVMTSTQYVYKSKSRPFPLFDNEYVPHTVYGLSKKYGEEITRNAGLECNWTIVRPANVWGPWNLRYPNELWKIIDKGLYLHPTKRTVIRTYAYVKNLTHQLDSIINADEHKIDKKTFYLGDLPIDSYLWLNELSMELRGKKVIHLPQLFFRFAAFLGDLLLKLNIKFPIYSQRFNNMIEDFYAPTNITISEFGLYSDDLNICMKETNEWIRGEGVEFFDYWKNKKRQ